LELFISALSAASQQPLIDLPCCQPGIDLAQGASTTFWEHMCVKSQQEDPMPLFITQGRFTQDAIKGMLAKPEDRAEGVSQLFAKSGGKLLAYYITFGEYDFLIVSEGPQEGAAVSAIVAAASGAVTDLKTTLAMTSGDMKSAFAKAGAVAASFRPAGAKT
jgi:uncharacterized protein with GYD domain